MQNEGIIRNRLKIDSAVTNAQALETNSEKADAAGKAILAAAEQAGISLSESLKNLLLELAVQKLKGTFGAAAATSTAADGD